VIPVRNGNPQEAFIAGIHAGQQDRNATPVEIANYRIGRNLRGQLLGSTGEKA